VEIVRDICLILIVFGIPPYFLLRLQATGIPLGTLTMWFTALAACEIRCTAHPWVQRSGLLIWLCVGWAVSLLYCLAFYAALRRWQRMRERRSRPSAARGTAPHEPSLP